MTKRVTAGPFTLELPANGCAILYEADEGGTDHRLPGGVGYFEALIQFAGEVIRLQAMIGAGGADHHRREETAFQAGVEAMRELAGYVAIHACLVPPDGGAPTDEEREMCAEVARQIYEAGMPLRPKGWESAS